MKSIKMLGISDTPAALPLIDLVEGLSILLEEDIEILRLNEDSLRKLSLKETPAEKLELLERKITYQHLKADYLSEFLTRLQSVDALTILIAMDLAVKHELEINNKLPESYSFFINKEPGKAPAILLNTLKIKPKQNGNK